MAMIVIDMIKIVDLFPRLIPEFLLRSTMIDALLLLIRLHHSTRIPSPEGIMNPLCLNSDITILAHLIGRDDHYHLVVLLLVVGMMDLLVRIKVHLSIEIMGTISLRGISLPLLVQNMGIVPDLDLYLLEECPLHLVDLTDMIREVDPHLLYLIIGIVSVIQEMYEMEIVSLPEIEIQGTDILLLFPKIDLDTLIEEIHPLLQQDMEVEAEEDTLIKVIWIMKDIYLLQLDQLILLHPDHLGLLADSIIERE